MDCSTLASETDQKVCQEYTSSRDWLLSVQKISAGGAVPDLTTANGRLFIFDSIAGDNTQAVYVLPSSVNLSPDSALVGNARRNAKPQLLLGESEDGSQMAAVAAGHYLLANVEVKSRTRVFPHQMFISTGADHVEFSGVTLTSEVSSLDTADTSLVTLMGLAWNSAGSATPAEFDIHDSEFLIPDVEPSSATLSLIAVFLQGAVSSSYGSPIRVKLSNNSIVTRDYNTQPGNINAVAVSSKGHVELQPGSNCSSIVDLQGQDLLAANHDRMLWADSVLSGENQAIGFTNGYAWGWVQEQGLATVKYEAWDYWQGFGVNTRCSHGGLPTSEPDQKAGGSGLAKIIVPVVVGSVAIVVAVAALLVGRHYIRKHRRNRLMAVSSSREPDLIKASFPSADSLEGVLSSSTENLLKAAGSLEKPHEEL